MRCFVYRYGLDHDEMVKLAESVPPGCDGVRFLPYLTGERSPNWPDATGALVGLRPGTLANPAVRLSRRRRGRDLCAARGREADV